MTPLVQIQNVSKQFAEGANAVHALSNVSLTVEAGEFTALCGPSGSGKTTLLNLMGCLSRPTQGDILVEGQKVSSFSQEKLANIRLYKLGFIFQDYNLIPTFSVFENIEYLLWLQKVPAGERKKRILEVCQRFGISHLISRRPAKLSRGQQQRVAVARAIVHRPSVVLGDELTANLDHKTGAELMDFLRELNEKEKVTFIYATHDPVMMDRAKRIVKMTDGRILSA